MTSVTMLKCPHCGWTFRADDSMYQQTLLVPYHDWPRPLRQVCPGAKQTPRNAESDHRPLWKDEEIC